MERTYSASITWLDDCFNLKTIGQKVLSIIDYSNAGQTGTAYKLSAALFASIASIPSHSTRYCYQWTILCGKPHMDQTVQTLPGNHQRFRL